MVQPVRQGGAVDRYGGRTTASGVWVGPRRRAGTPNPGSANQQVRAENPGVSYADAQRYIRDEPALTALISQQGQQQQPQPNLGGSGNRSGGGRRRGGGGGGGAANHSQAQMDWMSQLLNSGAYQVNPATYDALRANVSNATTQDQAAATQSYDALDRYLSAHQSNPYGDVQLTHAEGGGADAGYGAFQNVLALLGANARDSNASRAAESQMARTYSGNQIGAVDNAYLFNIQQQQAQAQQALDAERRQGLMQMMQLVGAGARAPDMSTFNFGGAPAAAAAPAAPSQQDFFNWFNTQAPDQQAAFRSTYG